jgi:hypothetical protein
MKLIFSLFFVFIGTTLFSQVVINSAEYEKLKKSNSLSGVQLLQDTSVQNSSNVVISPTYNTKSNGCECYIEPDASYSLALAPNDDGSSAPIALPFSVCLYGQTYNQIYINNNGNVTFDNPMGTFSATAFPSVGDAIVAPFWGDVDTRNGLGQVLYKITPTAVYVNWVDVGYYSTHGDKRNTFQLVLTDGADPAIEGGNVAFCYKDMAWTTGDASSGVNGFGGVPATAGANKGDGTAFFLISRFDHAGADFDGALGNPDGISWLDDKSFYFDACNVGNVPPIPDGISACDTFKICAMGDTADISLNFLSPENNQSTSITWTNGGLTNLQEIANLSGNTASLILRVIGDVASIGTYNVTITATDDAAPVAGVTTLSFVIQIDTIGLNLNPILTPLGGCGSVVASVLNGPYDSYLWDDFTVNPTNTISQTQNVGVTVSLDGCYKRVENEFIIGQPFTISLTGNPVICAPDTTVLISVVNQNQYDSITWGFSDISKDSLFSNNLTVGNYTLTLWDINHYCSEDTSFTISSVIEPVIFEETNTCDFNYYVQGTISQTGGIWSSIDTCIHFLPNNAALNPQIVSTVSGEHTIVFTDNLCNNVVSAIIDFIPYPWTQTFDSTICTGSTIIVSANVNNTIDTYQWSTGATTPTIEVSAAGEYIVTGTNECYSIIDTASISTKICEINAPNVMSLSSQVGNNMFFVDYAGVKEFNCSILNRWGNVIYEYTDPAGGWDGKSSNGNVVDEGTYFYIIKATFENNEEITKHGFVQLKY